MMLASLLQGILILVVMLFWDMKIRALWPIFGSDDSRKRHEMRFISKLGNLHPLSTNERFFYI